MSDYKKIWKECKSFYLIVFAITTAITLLHAFVLIGEKTREIKQMGSSLGTVSFCSAVADLSTDLSICGLVPTILALVLILYIRHGSLSDIRQREFLLGLPVKRGAILRLDYCLIVFGILVENIIFGAVLSLKQLQINQTSFEQQKLWVYLALYALYVLIIFSALYLGMILAKTGFVGMFLVGLLSFFVYQVCDDVEGVFSMLNYYQVYEEVDNAMFHVLAVLSPYNMFDYGIATPELFMNVETLYPILGLFLLVFLIILIMIWGSCKYSEKADGRVFVTRKLDYGFGILFVLVALLLMGISILCVGNVLFNYILVFAIFMVSYFAFFGNETENNRLVVR